MGETIPCLCRPSSAAPPVSKLKNSHNGKQLRPPLMWDPSPCQSLNPLAEPFTHPKGQMWWEAGCNLPPSIPQRVLTFFCFPTPLPTLLGRQT